MQVGDSIPFNRVTDLTNLGREPVPGDQGDYISDNGVFRGVVQEDLSILLTEQLRS